MNNCQVRRSIAAVATRCSKSARVFSATNHRKLPINGSQRYFHPASRLRTSRPITQLRQRRYESTKSTDNKAGAVTGTNTSKEVTNEEAIRATKEAIQALKDAKARTSSETIIKNATADASRKQRSTLSDPTLWSKLRTPVLFGAGLYLGLVLFGEHRETKRGSDYLAELKASFEDADKKR